MLSANLLERELSTFQNLKLELARQSLGKFALVHGERLIGVYDSYEDALQAGYEIVGLDEPFLVRQVERTETVHHIYRGALTEC